MSATQAPKRPAKKLAEKKTVKTAKKATTKPEPKAKKDGLRKPQLRILAVLAKGKALSRPEISEKAPVDSAACTEYLGSPDPAVRAANDKKHFPSLLGLGHIKAEQHEGEPVKYVITASGKKALESSAK